VRIVRHNLIRDRIAPAVSRYAGLDDTLPLNTERDGSESAER